MCRSQRHCSALLTLSAMPYWFVANGRRIVVVSHVSPIKAAIAWALGTDPSTSWRMHLDTAAVTRISVTSRGVALVSFNETHHLLADPGR